MQFTYVLNVPLRLPVVVTVVYERYTSEVFGKILFDRKSELVDIGGMTHRCDRLLR
jgi:hypothetical protein